ncbi:MAG: hypothetical protein DRJ10_18630 [Bacteroidetes bacterium]|nr:MAG: hypothetical protein DRJ10_18630 [Bacteroidota bacterium]
MEINTKYQVLEWLESRKILIQTWKATSKNLSQESFKSEMVKLTEMVKAKKNAKLLVDMRKFEFIVVPEIQNWINANINSVISMAGCKKVAFVISHDLFTRISVEQAIEDAASLFFESRYFKNVADAENWID